MKDSLSKARRSWNMGRIRSKNTKPEIIVRSLLHRAGFRFRLHDKNLPGKPDIILSKFKTVVFVHGCFWHRHENCKDATTPNTRKEFWLKKFAQNIKRDKEVKEQLEKLGWKIITIWECTVMEKPEMIVELLQKSLHIGVTSAYVLPTKKELQRVAEKSFKKNI